jgi:uncharacterized membrane protein
MVQRMTRRGALLTPLVVLASFLLGDHMTALAAAIGMALALLNLLIAGRVLGGIAENAPHLLVPAAMATLFVGLVLVIASGVVINRIESLSYAVTGLVMVGAHMTLVIWEAAGSLLKIPSKKDIPSTDPQGIRS